MKRSETVFTFDDNELVVQIEPKVTISGIINILGIKVPVDKTYDFTNVSELDHELFLQIIMKL